MSNTGFKDTITAAIKAKKTHICVGLDSDYDKLPVSVKSSTGSISEAIFEFNKKIIDATHDVVVAYKPNVVFYAAHGTDGLEALKKTNEYIKEVDSTLVTIADCKRSEMKRSAELAGQELFDAFHFDSFTNTPWFGFDTIEPFLSYEGKAVFVPCHDSNPSAGDIQDLVLEDGSKLYEYATNLVSHTWNKEGNVFIEAPLTYPDILQNMVNIAGDDEFFLVVGLGAQGGDIDKLKMFEKNKNFTVSASRGIIFASTDDDFAEAARQKSIEYRDKIQDILY